jgi:hypothetical protein
LLKASAKQTSLFAQIVFTKVGYACCNLHNILIDEAKVKNFL